MGVERGKPVWLPRGRLLVRAADGDAGKGRRSKRKPLCNGRDTGCKITRRETGQTSAWCLDARTPKEPTQKERQMAAESFSAGAPFPERASAEGKYRVVSRMFRHLASGSPSPRVAFEILEPSAVKAARSVLR